PECSAPSLCPSNGRCEKSATRENSLSGRDSIPVPSADHDRSAFPPQSGHAFDRDSAPHRPAVWESPQPLPAEWPCEKCDRLSPSKPYPVSRNPSPNLSTLP